MDLVFAHLTDIHIQDDDDLEILEERVTSLSGAICEHITVPEETVVFLCITGDFAYSGKKNQYICADLFVYEIERIINENKKPFSLNKIFVPGNHDCDFTDESNGVRDAVIVSPAFDASNSQLLEMCTRIQKNFFEFAEGENALFPMKDRILTVNTVNIPKLGFDIDFHCINTSWCSAEHEQKGKMRMVLERVGDKTEKTLVVTLMHHDAEWLDWNDRAEWDDYQKQYPDIVFVGHDHKSEAIMRKNFDESSNYHIMGNQLYDKNNASQSGFNILKINTTSWLECFFSYEWNGKYYTKSLAHDYKEFVRNRYRHGKIRIKDSFLSRLNKLDIDIQKRDNKLLTLDDIFAFPTLKEESKKARMFRTMQSVLSYIQEHHFISIRGVKESGKTALLRQLFKSYFSIGKFPVSIDIRKINTGDGEALNKVFENIYDEIYENISGEEIMQRSKDERICLIDDYQDIRLTDSSSKKFLEYLTSNFEIVILAKNHTLDIIDPLTYIETNDYLTQNFQVLMLQPVKHTFKDRIIEKWLMLDESNENIDGVVFDSKKRLKNSQLQDVMKNNYFNSTPLDFLLVLSYLDQEHPTQLNYSRYSYVYDSLILEKLNVIGNNITNTISMYKMILQMVAYGMYCDGSPEWITEQKLYVVLFNYLEKYSGAKEKKRVSDIVDKLVEGGFLVNRDNQYAFKYSYMYYYFVSSYIDCKLSPEEKTKVVHKIFSGIDVDTNYNIALFLIYSMNKEHEVIPLVEERVNSLLVDFTDFQYEQINPILSEWGKNIEEHFNREILVPLNEEIPELRRRAMVSMENEEINADKTEHCGNGAEVEAEVISEKIKIMNTEVIKLRRLVDFLGNILKNYSGEMENDYRIQSIDIMFKSVLKILGAFISFSQFLVDQLISMLEKQFEEGDERFSGAKSELIEITTSLFSELMNKYISANIMYLSHVLGTNTIHDNLQVYSMNQPNEFVRMTLLDYEMFVTDSRLPVSQIADAFTGKNALSNLSKYILKQNVVSYLCGYQYDYRDKQAVCSSLGIKISNVLVEEKKRRELE